MCVRLDLALALAATALAQNPIRGYPSDQWKPQHEREHEAQTMPSPERIRIYMERMALRPHHAGSAGAKAVAEYTAGLLKEWGIDTRVETFEPLLPYPTSRILEMIAPVKYRAGLNEAMIEGDTDTGDNGQ